MGSGRQHHGRGAQHLMHPSHPRSSLQEGAVSRRTTTPSARPAGRGSGRSSGRAACHSRRRGRPTLCCRAVQARPGRVLRRRELNTLYIAASSVLTRYMAFHTGPVCTDSAAGQLAAAGHSRDGLAITGGAKVASGAGGRGGAWLHFRPAILSAGDAGYWALGRVPSCSLRTCR